MDERPGEGLQMPDHLEAEESRDDAPVTTSKRATGDATLVAEAVTINRPARELYDFWRDVGNLAAFMDNIESVEVLDSARSRWRVKAPAGKTIEWESVITDDQVGRSIAWRSADGADVANSGKVEFIDAGARGTVVRAVIAYEPPAGAIGQFIAKLFQREPRLQSRRDLHRFKQLMETGEISTNARNWAMYEQELEA
jgi:uncharacterized membrane protein